VRIEETLCVKKSLLQGKQIKRKGKTSGVGRTSEKGNTCKRKKKRGPVGRSQPTERVFKKKKMITGSGIT